MGNGNGTSTNIRPQRDKRRLAKIVFAGPIEDARGKEVRELYEDEADWRMVVELMRVPVGAAPAQGPTLVGIQAPPQMQMMPVPVPMYEIRQNVPERANEIVLWHVPVAQVRCVRIPHELVEIRDARGEVVERQLMWCSQAAAYREEQAKKAALVRGDETVQ